jgi:hypothetical protein
MSLLSESLGQVDLQFFRVLSTGNRVVGIEQVGPQGESEFLGEAVGFVAFLMLVKPVIRGLIGTPNVEAWLQGIHLWIFGPKTSGGPDLGIQFDDVNVEFFHIGTAIIGHLDQAFQAVVSFNRLAEQRTDA